MDLRLVAERVMLANGFAPQFSPLVQSEVHALQQQPPETAPSATVRDMRRLLWSSIDNDESRDLDQIECAEPLGDGRIRVLVGIADVDVFVRQGSAIDQHAERETTSVYTGVRTFPMLPAELSTMATSLNEDGERAALITEFIVEPDGDVTDGHVYRALVKNHARLTYNAVGAWIEGKGSAPAAVAASPVLEEQLRLQDAAAQALRGGRLRRGALDIETIETRPVITQDRVVAVERQQKNRATELIEDFMIAANSVMAKTLDAVSSIRRVVRTPKRWDRIVALAAERGAQLPAVADARALNGFLSAQRAADPDHFADLSLAVIKLMGPGEYVLERPGDPEQGHFGLAIEDYTHSTAPNRRFADLVTQRVVKALIEGAAPPYTDEQLGAIAINCTQRADASRKVEREMSKRISAVAMSHRIGEVFNAIVTGASAKGTFVRVLQPSVEGMVVQGKEGLDVGDRVRVKLVRTDANVGFIDFARAES